MLNAPVAGAAKKAARQAVGSMRAAFGKLPSKPLPLSTNKLVTLIDELIEVIDGRKG